MATWYTVSDKEDEISIPVASPDTHEDPTLFPSVDAAALSIERGEYGEYGTRYILKVDLSVAAVMDRGWTIVRKQPEDRKAEGS